MFPLRFKLGKTPSDVDRTLRHVVGLAASNVPAYRTRLRISGISAALVRGAEDLKLLPVVKKESMFGCAGASDNLHSCAQPSRCVRSSTSGYSGLPIDIFMSKPEAFYRRSLLLAAWRSLAELPLRLRVADVGAWVRNERGYEFARHGPVSILRVSMKLPLQSQLDLIAKYAPHVVTAYPTVLALLAEQSDDPAPIASAKLVATRGEILHAEERALIERAFQCRLADFYNCEEIGNVASECPIDPSVLHVNTDACIIVIVDDCGHPVPMGEEGRILMTNLYNCTMPFIRYEAGDRGQLAAEAPGAACACGSRRPRMRLLEGREDDYIILSNGRRLSPRLVGIAIYRAADALSKAGCYERCFRQFQVVQEELDDLKILVVPANQVPKGMQDILCAELLKLHPGLRCEVELVEAIPLEPSGKRKKVLSQVPFQADGSGQSLPSSG